MVFANALGFEEDTPFRDAVRALVKSIRLNVFERRSEDDPKLKPVQQAFLDAFDLATPAAMGALRAARHRGGGERWASERKPCAFSTRWAPS